MATNRPADRTMTHPLMTDTSTHPIIKWRASGNIYIQRVEIERETAALVWVLTDYDGKRMSRARRERKITTYHSCHDTWQEARDFLLKKAQQRLEACNRSVKQAMHHVDLFNRLTPP
jgi:hypothetical protein